MLTHEQKYKDRMDRISLYERFHEGCEMEDAVRALLSAAHIMLGINLDREADLALIAVEMILGDYMEAARDRTWNMSWDDYNEIDPELYAHFLDGAQKMSKEEYEG